MLFNSYPAVRFPLALQPAPAWLAILALVFCSGVAILLGAGNLLRLGFPLGCFAVGLFLYQRYPILYVGFTWWLWFLTPFIRRLIDYRTGWLEPNPVLLAPYLATVVTIATFLRHLPRLYRQDGLPFLLSFIAVIYGFLIGLVNSMFGISNKITFLQKILESAIGKFDFTYTPIGVTVATLEWLTPVLFSYHLFINWQYYPEYRQNTQRIFCWGVLLTGVYGVLQYLVAPGWDRMWLWNVIETGNTSFGRPEPLGIRVFSTMNAPGPYAMFMVAGLLLLLSGQGVIRFLATTVGYLAFLLTLSRTAWLSWSLGILIFITSLKPRFQMRLLVTLLVIGVCAFPLTTIEPFSEIISTRLQTFSNVQQDGSFQARAGIYDKVLGLALFELIGNGFGLPGMDSAIIDMFLSIGWLGFLPYIGGIILLVFKLLQSSKSGFDPFVSAGTAISLSILATLGLGNPLSEVTGVILWSFLGIALAGHKYYQYQRGIGLV